MHQPSESGEPLLSDHDLSGLTVEQKHAFWEEQTKQQRQVCTGTGVFERETERERDREIEMFHSSLVQSVANERRQTPR
jgi:hypothetical protein